MYIQTHISSLYVMSLLACVLEIELRFSGALNHQFIPADPLWALRSSYWWWALLTLEMIEISVSNVSYSHKESVCVYHVSHLIWLKCV